MIEIQNIHGDVLYQCETTDTLCGADLRGANLFQANLGQADLRGADLFQANLCEADLRRADLFQANLCEANLYGADLRLANLREARLREADLRGADLCAANLSRADLGNAYLRQAKLGGASLQGADLRGADVSGADLSNADLRKANLGRASLRSVDLQGADVSGASLRSADLRGADLSRADLSNADLREAQLRGVNLRWSDLRGMTGIHPDRCTDLRMLLDQPGPIRAYKLVTPDGEGPWYGGITYTGEQDVFCVEDADTDEGREDGPGIHVATLPWCLDYWQEGYRILILECAVADIAAIPLATDGPFRLRRCRRVGEVPQDRIHAALGRVPESGTEPAEKLVAYHTREVPT